MPPRLRSAVASLSVLAIAGTTMVLASLSGTSAAEAPRVPADPVSVDSVLAISVDGLNPTAIRKLGVDGTPHLHEFMAAGASTLNARTEYEQTVTLPNHTGMVTGRRILATKGGHGVVWNDDRLVPSTVQRAAGRDVDSVFTAVADAGGSTALFASKTKFKLWRRSWPRSIDRTTIVGDNARLVDQVVGDLQVKDREFRFLHLSLPDVVGHARGFMSRPYLRAVRRVDHLVGRVVRAVTSDPSLASSMALVLTSDHGGRGAVHSDPTRPDNYRVAFMVRGPRVAAGTDLYELNPDYRDPGRTRPFYSFERQPIRNGAVANLSLDLLGLGPVPGSEHDVAQDLDVARELEALP